MDDEPISDKSSKQEPFELSSEGKDFSRWHKLVPFLESKPLDKSMYFAEGQIWWCALGLNIDIEIDGKDDDYERPVFILRVFGKSNLLVIPITTQGTDHLFRFKLSIFGKDSFLVFSQLRTVSAKRMMRKILTVSPEKFNEIRIKLKEII